MRIVSLAILVNTLLLANMATAQENVGTEFLPPQATLAVVVKPKAIYGSPLLQMVPWEVLNVKSKELAGIPIQSIDSVLVVASPPGTSGEPEIGMVVKLNQATPLENLLIPIREAGELTGAVWPGTNKNYLKGSSQVKFDVYPVDDKTYILAMPEALKSMLAQKETPQASPLAKLVQTDRQPAEAQAFLVMEPIRELAQFLVADPKLQGFPGLKELPGQLEHIQIIGDLDMEKGGLTVKLTAKNPGQAEEVKKTVSQLLDLAVQIAIQVGQPPKTNEAEENAFRQYVERVSKTLRAALEPEASGNQVTMTTVGKSGTSPQVMIASGTAVLMPLIATARQQAFRSGSVNNLKHIMLAMHNYHDTFGKLPANSYDENGKPLLSWRVHILPFVEQAALYQQFHLDEPWDSEHNRKLVAMMPVQYLSPSTKGELAAQGKTRYQMPLGEGLPGSVKKRLRFQDLTDGLSNIIAVAEVPASDAVIWTRPDDFHVNMDSPLESFLPGDTKGFNSARYDGSVQYMLKKELADNILKALLTHQGGEAVNF
ncbi:DUF1559 domain-containing protein [Blastopirellula marina]|nr:DUF1559 domain-containing protein [Blastopirellula marina]